MIRKARTPVADRIERPDAVRLTRALGAFRRRRRLVLALRFLCTGLAVAVVAGEALALAVRAEAVTTLWLLAGALGAAAIISILTAAARTPSLSGTARLVDRHASLKNRMATALQFVHSDDVMAALVVRDAAQRLSGLDPAVVFPRVYPARGHLLVAAVTVSSLVFAASVSRVASAPQSPSRSAGMATPGAATQARPGEPGPRQADAAGAPAARGGASASAPQGTQARADDRTPRDPAMDRAAPPDGRAGPPATSQSPSRQEAAAGSPRLPPAAPDSTAASDRAGAGGAGAPAPARDARAAAGAREGAGQGGAVPGRSARAGGGIKGGALAGDATPAVPPRRATGRTGDYAVEYQAAWTRAQAALAEDRVAPPLREYVRRYFAAIRTPRAP